MRSRITELACDYGRYGYRRITGLLHNEGWRVNHKRVERIWRQEGLKVPRRQPKRRRLWLKDGSCVRLRPERKHHVQITSEDVLFRLADLFIKRGTPEHIRSDNGPEFTSKAIRGWLNRLGVRTLFIEPGSPWENGYCESFNGKLRDELLNREIFDTILEARGLTEMWRREYNHIRPHSSLGYKPPAPEAKEPASTMTRSIVRLT